MSKKEVNQFDEVERVFSALGNEEPTWRIAPVVRKQHSDILRKIDSLPFHIRDKLGVVEEYYFDVYGRKNRCYSLNRDAYTYLILSMAGDCAADFRFDYVKRFNCAFRLWELLGGREKGVKEDQKKGERNG